MARPAYSTGMIQPVTFLFNLIPGTALVAPAASTQKMRIPANLKVIGVTANAGQKGGTFGTTAIDVQVGGVTILTTTIDAAAAVAGTPVDREGSGLAAGAASVAKDAILSVVVTTSGGTSPTWADVTVQIDAIPLGS